MQEIFLTPLLRHPGRAWQLRASGARTLAESLEPAFDSASRRRGLLGRDHLPAGHAIVIAPSNAIHTIRMRFAIDVLFVDRGGLVIGIRHALRPWRIAFSMRAFAVIELPAGTLTRCPVQVGERVTVEAPDA